MFAQIGTEANGSGLSSRMPHRTLDLVDGICPSHAGFDTLSFREIRFPFLWLKGLEWKREGTRTFGFRPVCAPLVVLESVGSVGNFQLTACDSEC